MKIYIILIIVAALTLATSFKIGSIFWQDYSDPYNVLYAVLFMWIFPVGLGIGIAALLSMVLL